MSVFNICVGLLIAFLLVSWLNEKRLRRQAEARAVRIQQGLRSALDRERDLTRRCAQLDLDLRIAQRRHTVPTLGLPHHEPGPLDHFDKGGF